MTPRWWPWAAGAAALAAMCLLVWALWPAPTPPDVARVDEQRQEREAFDSLDAAEIARMEARWAAAEAAERQAREREAVALAIAAQQRQRASVLADSAAKLGEVVAAVSVWRGAYESARVEADSLRVVVASVSTRADTLTSLLTDTRTALTKAVTRGDEWQRIANEERAIRQRTEAASRCRILGVAECPTRVSTALVALGVGAVGTLYLTRD